MSKPATPILIVFAVLVMASLVSAEGLTGTHAVSLAIIAIACFKSMLIASEFMELRHAHRGLAIGFATWLASMMAMLGYFYMVPLTQL